ncbi:MAG: biotin transporter BioY, partial [Staphylococcus sp.]|nr:biotin transporter BioY [Staphylococcus sp.]
IIMGFIIHIPVSKAFLLSFTFMPGDIIKAIIASLIGVTLLNHSRFKSLIQ